MGSKVTDRVTRVIIRYFLPIVVVAFLLTAVSTVFTVKLFANLRTDLEELLPDTARSVRDLKSVRNSLRSTQSLAVLVFSKNTEASKRLIEDLAARVPSRLPKDVDRVEYKIDRELKFFKEKRPLFIDLKDLEKIRDYVRNRIDYEKALTNPLNLFRTETIKEPALNFGGLERKYSDKVSSFTRFKDGYYANPDETVRVLLVHLRGSGGIAAALRVTQGVSEVIKQLNPKTYSRDIDVKFAGDVEDFVEEHSSLISDLVFSTIVVTILVTAALLIYYRELRMTIALLLSLFMGTLWTFGIAYFVVGYLNANSAFLGSIVIGNGINFGIIIMARYLEYRRAGRRPTRALILTLRKTSGPTLMAALAAGLSYGSLIMTSFRGFHQFGIIGLIGMVLCWASAFAVMPAFIILFEKAMPRSIGPIKREHLTFSSVVARIVSAVPHAILFASATALALSCVVAVHYKGQLIETDTTKLRDRRSVEHGSVYLSRYLDEIFGRYMTPLILMTETPAKRDEVEAKLKSEKQNGKVDGLLANIYSLSDFVPPEQEKKLQVMREIRGMLKPSIFAKLSNEDRAKAREVLGKSNPAPFSVNDLPPLVLDRFRMTNGRVGNMVIAEPSLNKIALTSANNQNLIVSTLRNAADSAKKGTPVVGTLPITVDMYQSVRRDGPRATALAFLSVILLVILLFRRFNPIALTLFALILGISWLAGIVLGFGLQINFLNFIALPITFGIGVDYSANIVQRYRNEGRGRVREAVRGTGGAVALASLTTIIGYGSLLLAGNQAFFSFGRLAILGEVTTLTAAIFSLPAFLEMRDRRFRRTAEVSMSDAPVSEVPRSKDEPRKIA